MGLLRLILAITVIIAHSNAAFGLKFTGGLIAVEVFFIISGFYMSMILDRKYTGKGSYTLFLSNRVLRLYPLFWVVLLLTIFVSIILYSFLGDWSGLSSYIWSGLSSYIEYFDVMSMRTILFQIFVNIALFGQDIVLFLGFNPETGEMYFTHDFRTSSPMFYTFLLVPQAWSLGIEVMFYLIAPFLVRKSNLVIISIISLSLLIRIFTYSIGYTNDPWTYRFFPSELSLFLLGTVSYRLYDRYKIHKYKILNFNPTPVVLLSFFTIIIFYQFIPKSFWFVGFGYVNKWLFYVFVCLSIPFIFDFTKSSKIDSRIGELSYPVYISHTLVIASISPFFSPAYWHKYQGEWTVIFTILLSYILVRLISDPIEKIRQSRVQGWEFGKVEKSTLPFLRNKTGYRCGG